MHNSFIDILFKLNYKINSKIFVALSIAKSKLLIWSSFEVLSAQSETHFITIHFFKAQYSLATDKIAKASISTKSQEKSFFSFSIFLSQSINWSQVKQIQFKISQNFCKS